MRSALPLPCPAPQAPVAVTGSTSVGPESSGAAVRRSALSGTSSAHGDTVRRTVSTYLLPSGTRAICVTAPAHVLFVQDHPRWLWCGAAQPHDQDRDGGAGGG